MKRKIKRNKKNKKMKRKKRRTYRAEAFETDVFFNIRRDSKSRVRSDDLWVHRH